MYCQKCGSEQTDTSKFCNQCGAQMVVLSPSNAESQKQKTVKPKMSFGAALAWVILLPLCIAILAMAIADMQRTNHIDLDGSVRNISSAVGAEIRGNAVGTQSLLSNSLEVDPMQSRYLQFTVDNRWMNARLVGYFTAAGGSGNDIEAFVREKPSGGQTWYASGRTSTGKLDVSLTPGTYYLVFDNGFSFISTKTIMGEISLNYEYPR